MTELQPAPNVTLGSSETVGRVARTGLQVSAGVFVVQGLVLFGMPFSQAQEAWAGIALTVVVTWAQNAWESHRGRKLLGAAPTPATAPPTG